MRHLALSTHIRASECVRKEINMVSERELRLKRFISVVTHINNNITLDYLHCWHILGPATFCTRIKRYRYKTDGGLIHRPIAKCCIDTNSNQNS
jgi:hypothetical protein